MTLDPEHPHHYQHRPDHRYDLATSCEASPDGLTWTVTIRDDVHFTDGEPLTAADVAFTYNTVKESSSVNDFTMLDRAEAVDKTTVRFHMLRPYSIWPYTMAIVGILPEHCYDSATYGSAPVGSGRYVLRQWDRGQQVILEANPDYYGQAPKMKKVTILFMEEERRPIWRSRRARRIWLYLRHLLRPVSDRLFPPRLRKCGQPGLQPPRRPRPGL